jgi:hypothetical protein
MVGFLKSEIEEKNATGACRQPRCVSGDSQESDVNAARLNVAWQTAARPDWQPPAASRALASGFQIPRFCDSAKQLRCTGHRGLITLAALTACGGGDSITVYCHNQWHAAPPIATAAPLVLSADHHSA